MSETPREQADGLSLNIQRDALAISELLDDSTREREMYHRLILAIRHVLSDGLDVPLLDLPTAIESALLAARAEGQAASLQALRMLAARWDSQGYDAAQFARELRAALPVEGQKEHD